MTCARCGRRFRKTERGANLVIYSRWTGAHYCADLNACAKRAKRRKNVGSGLPTQPTPARGEVLSPTSLAPREPTTGGRS